jgi:probable rRNA maturation factor
MKESRALKLDLARATRAWSPTRSRMASWASAALGRRGEGREIAIRVGRGQREPRAEQTLARQGQTDERAFVSGAETARVLVWLRSRWVTSSSAHRSCARKPRSTASQSKAHWAHMIVHGSLHLAGYDHELGRRERLRMERREISVLKRFGIGNPYL